jgi:phytanoyl-CoA hydroxylase
MITEQHKSDWETLGFFILKGFADPAQCNQMAEETIDIIRANPPSGQPGQQAYRIEDSLFIQPESQPMPGAAKPEDWVAKVFNTHLGGAAHDFAVSAEAGAVVSDLLGPDVDVFQSMFILKNPGAWGQPWHQDSYYFNFDQQPQVGLWLAISEATLENGCLSVLPGSHENPVLTHVPDRREGANQGYLEILDTDEAEAIPVLMEPGDLLVFNSYLLHKSVDNRGTGRRAAMVYHYGRADSVNLAPPEVQKIQNMVTRWVPVMRGGAPVSA